MRGAQVSLVLLGVVVGGCALDRPEHLPPVIRSRPGATIVERPEAASETDPLAELALAERATALGKLPEGRTGALRAYGPAPIDLSVLGPRPRLADAPTYAPVLAAWPKICERRGRMPDDELDYALAWCAQETKGDTARAAKELLGVMASNKPALVAAAIDDYAALVVYTPMPGSDAAFALAQAGADSRLARAALVDAYLVADRELDAKSVARWTGFDPAVACRIRLHDTLALAKRGLAGDLLDLETTPCAREAHAIRCAIGVAEGSACPPPMTTPDATRAGEVATLMARWSTAASGADWLAIAERAAARIHDTSGVERLAVAALANALVADCAVDGGVVATAHALADSPDHDRSLDHHLAILAQATPESCRALHGEPPTRT